MSNALAPHLQALAVVLDEFALNTDDTDETGDLSPWLNIDEHPAWSFEVNGVRVSVEATTKRITGTQEAAYAAAIELQDRIVTSGPWRLCNDSDLTIISVPSPEDDYESGDISGWFARLRLALRVLQRPRGVR